MRFFENPPDAASLMASARCFGNYDLPAALADLIDNSIKAGAKCVDLACLYDDGNPTIRILDDGCGMTSSELRNAMRPASSHPDDPRLPSDLGRFGWGLKSASFSQCKRLTVLSRKAGELSGAVWDLDEVQNWRMGFLEGEEVLLLADPALNQRDGVEVIWTKCDRLSEDCTLGVADFNARIVEASGQLATIFHRYLSGEVRREKLRIRLNGQTLEPWDPFYRQHPATQELEEEPLPVEGQIITIQPFILPHYSKLLSNEYERLAGEEGFVRSQGFYVYRNHRLIISGTWFRLVRHGELSQLVRVRVDIPNSLDRAWKITIDKSDAQLPAALRARLKQIVDGLRRRSGRVYRSRGGRLDRKSTVSMWTRHAQGGRVRYSVNRAHPIIAALLDSDPKVTSTIEVALKMIEQTFPITAFGQDALSDPDSLSQATLNPQDFKTDLLSALPTLLSSAGGDFKALHSLLRTTEPWCEAYDASVEVLKAKGWFIEKS